MGKTAADIEREIDELRADTDRVLVELEHRIRDTINIRTQAEQHPLVATAITFGTLMGLGLVLYLAFFRPREVQPLGGKLSKAPSRSWWS